jgi:uncharacterized membrane protein
MQRTLEKISKTPPAKLRHDLRDTSDPGLRLRRAMVGASLFGIASMGVVVLFQSGMVKHLKDPPLQDFDSDKVNASDTAYGWGTPDAPISILAHAVNLVLATLGGADRARKQRWIPLAATAASLPPALTSMRYLFYQMPVREKGWCPYCITDALMHMASFGFTLWESGKVIGRRH